jgi:Tfp pilus assembly protein PilN
MISVNLIPQDQQLRLARRERIKVWVVAVTAAVALPAVPTLLDELRKDEVVQLQQRYDAVLAQWKERRAELGSVTAQVAEARIRLERSSLLQSKRNWSGLIALTAKCIPDGCWLTSLRTDPAVPGPPRLLETRPTAVDGKTPAPPKPVVLEAPQSLRLTGYASRAAEPHLFVANLKATSVFSHVALENIVSESVRNGSYFRYDLLCEW